ncbi:hypothetical protein COY07_02615 [Candidatus Peregrinibacteria bacterium CG_4_10_14_0_2_um_filter_43_11]|nr:MAG: hypothetical protein COY07_02615 [Candidatus Peregrinibacteria bacterium CG_4_10_14_0_2_um_filter_43_11]
MTVALEVRDADTVRAELPEQGAHFVSVQRGNVEHVLLAPNSVDFTVLMAALASTENVGISNVGNVNPDGTVMWGDAGFQVRFGMGLPMNIQRGVALVPEIRTAIMEWLEV